FLLRQYKFPVAPVPQESINVSEIGKALISTGKYGYSLPFEVISILLLAAMIGSIVIAKKRKD
ncbi:MAG: NADH-quinone oxidoreductase subunit J, partial [Bacteroidota bacterium]